MSIHSSIRVSWQFSKSPLRTLESLDIHTFGETPLKGKPEANHPYVHLLFFGRGAAFDRDTHFVFNFLRISSPRLPDPQHVARNTLTETNANRQGTKLDETTEKCGARPGAFFRPRLKTPTPKRLGRFTLPSKSSIQNLSEPTKLDLKTYSLVMATQPN